MVLNRSVRFSAMHAVAERLSAARVARFVNVRDDLRRSNKRLLIRSLNYRVAIDCGGGDRSA